MKKLIFSIALFTISMTAVNAQKSDSKPTTISIAANVGVPTSSGIPSRLVVICKPILP